MYPSLRHAMHIGLVHSPLDTSLSILDVLLIASWLSQAILPLEEPRPTLKSNAS